MKSNAPRTSSRAREALGPRSIRLPAHLESLLLVEQRFHLLVELLDLVLERLELGALVPVLDPERRQLLLELLLLLRSRRRRVLGVELVEVRLVGGDGV